MGSKFHYELIERCGFQGHVAGVGGLPYKIGLFERRQYAKYS